MTDIVDRLRREVVWESDVGDLLNAAADEIARLRLTDVEREAIEVAAAAYAADHGERFAEVLRNLLARLHT